MDPVDGLPSGKPRQMCQSMREHIEVFPENDRKPIGDQHDQGGECNREKGITRNGK